MREAKYLVEYQFENTAYGLRPLWVRFFQNKEDAEEFCKTQHDAYMTEFVEEF